MLEYDHDKYMAIALELAAKAKGYTAPNPMVGCVLVKNHEIIGQGYHVEAGTPHAEINAITDAKAACNSDKIAGSICYVSLEPCCHFGKTGPCVDALIEAKVAHVVCAIEDPNPLVAGKGIAKLEQHGIKVTVGVKAGEALELNRGFISRITKGRPFIRSKIAASLDGCVALANGQSKWITSSLSRNDVHHYRLFSDALVTTANTVIADNPSLNCRLNESEVCKTIKQPLRVVIDTKLRTSPEAKIYNIDSNCIIVTSDKNYILPFTRYSLRLAPQGTYRGDQTKINRSGFRGQAAESSSGGTYENSNNVQHFITPEIEDKLTKFKKLGIKIYYLPIKNNFLDMLKLWKLLAELGCNDVMIEAGAILNGYLLQNNLVDEWIIYQSGLLMGAGAQNMFRLNHEAEPFDSMSGLFKLKCKQITQLKDNWRIICSPE